MPPELAGLDRLRELSIWLSGNPAAGSALGGVLLGLRELRVLDIASSEIESLPGTLGSLTKLEALYADCSALVVLPDSIGDLACLRKLSLNWTRLQSLPSAIVRLKNLETLSACGTPLTALPASIGRLSRLVSLDVSCTLVSAFPAGLDKCANLAINRRSRRAIRALRACVAVLEKRGGPLARVLHRARKALYSALFHRLDRLQTTLDICGWREAAPGNPARCRRPGRQCCLYQVRCAYLKPEGCPVQSLSCKLWLCERALNHLAALTTSSRRSLRKAARSYQRTRALTDTVCRVLNIPLKGRLSKEDTFNPQNTDLPINTDIDHWYDNILLRPQGLYISTREAAAERAGKP